MDSIMPLACNRFAIWRSVKYDNDNNAFRHSVTGRQASFQNEIYL